MFLSGLYDGEQVKKGICSFVGTESARVLHFDLDLSDSPFTCIIIRRYRRILKEVEDIVPALDETFLELSELLSHVFKVFRQQPIKPYQPRLGSRGQVIDFFLQKVCEFP